MLVSNLAEAGGRIGRTYWINTLGAMGGALLVGLVFIPLLSLKGCLLGLAAIQTLLAVLLWPWIRLKQRSSALAGVGGIVLVVLAATNFIRLLPGPSPFDWSLGSEAKSPGAAPNAIEAHRDDVAGSVTVMRSESGVRVLRINGFEASSDSGASGYMPMMSHLPILAHGNARQVLVICFGTGSTAGAALLHPDVRVDVVDINQAVLDFAPSFKHANHGIHENPRANLILNDGRNYLATTTNSYDVITSEPMPPTHAGVVNLYSREYYALARERLNPGGLLVQWLPFFLLTDDQARSILRTVQDVFPETTLWLWNTTGLIMARKDAPVTVDWPTLSKAYQTPELANDLAKMDVPNPREFLQLYALSPKAVRTLTQSAPAITDDRPSLEFHPPRHNMTSVTARGITSEAAKIFSEIYSQRAREEPPVRSMNVWEKEEFISSFRIRNIQMSGDLYYKRGLPAEAAQITQAGLGIATAPADRAAFLYNLAVLAHEQGDNGKALNLLDRCLIESPGSKLALELKNKVQNSAKPPPPPVVRH
ncbi:MAG: hypothetical protein NTZ16_11835 [Verrucomicrobia bacterium]|nr:hypothetical protein [Verrucomicrobiota bacterium]